MFPTWKSPVKGGLLSSINFATRMWKIKGCDRFEGFLYTIDEFHITLRVIQLKLFINLACRV